MSAGDEEWRLQSWILQDADAVETQSPPVILGSGALGQVHAATYHGRDVAVKNLHLLSADWEGMISHEEREFVLNKLRNECAILARLRSDFIVNFVGMVLSPLGEPCAIIMERLRPFHATYSLPLDLVSWIAVMGDILRGLEVLEANDVVHRDIKMSNLLVAQNGSVKLGDLGEARAGLTRTGTIGAGTPVYMAPEIKREGMKPTSASDRFSVAVLAIAMALGEDPSPLNELDARGTQISEVIRRREQIERFGKQWPWAVDGIYRTLDNDPLQRPSVVAMRRMTIASSSGLREAQIQSESGSSPNNVGERAVGYILSEPALVTTDLLPRINGTEIYTGVDTLGRQLHALNGEDCILQSFDVLNVQMLAAAAHYYHLQDPAWQRLMGVCMEPAYLVFAEQEGTPLAELKPIVTDFVEVVYAIARALLAGHQARMAHGQLDVTNVLVTFDGGICFLNGGLNSKAQDAVLRDNFACDVRAFGILATSLLKGRVTEDFAFALSNMCGSMQTMHNIVRLLATVERFATVDVPQDVDDVAAGGRTSSVEGPVLMNEMISVVLPSLMTGRPEWAAAGAQWQLIACDLFTHLLGCNVAKMNAACERWIGPLMSALVNGGFVPHLRNLTKAALNFCGSESCTVECACAIAEAVLSAAEACLSSGFLLGASAIVADLNNFQSAYAHATAKQVQQITALLLRTMSACANAKLSEEEPRYAVLNRNFTGLPSVMLQTRPFADIRRDALFAAYTLVGSEQRTDFSWSTLYCLELEYMLDGTTLELLRDQTHVARQISKSGAVFLRRVAVLLPLLSQAGFLIATFECASLGLEVAKSLGTVGLVKELEVAQLWDLYCRSLLHVATSGAFVAAPSASESARTSLATARAKVASSLATPDENTSYSNIQSTFSLEVTQIVATLIEASIQQIGSPPCKLSFLGLGSMAHAAMSLYSDLEFAVLTDRSFRITGPGSVQEYVTRLVQLLELKIIFLGETRPLPDNRHQVQGLSFDSGGNTPLKKDPPLAGTASELMSQLTAENAGGDLIVIGTLAAPCCIHGDKHLFHSFVTAYNEALDSNKLSPLRWRHGQRLLQEALTFRVNDRFRPENGFDIKKTLYRLPSMALTAMAMLFDIDRPAEPLPLCALIDCLTERSLVESRLADALRAAFNLAARYRLQAHGVYGTENDMVYPYPGKPGEFALPRDQRMMVAQMIFTTLTPLANCFGDYLERLQTVVKKREQGVDVELEPCTDASRFFDAIILGKMAIVSRPDTFRSIKAEMWQILSTDSASNFRAQFRSWLTAEADPATTCGGDVIRYMVTCEQKVNEIHTLLAGLKDGLGRDNALLVRSCEGCLAEMLSLYGSLRETLPLADAAAQQQLMQRTVCTIGVISGVRSLLPTVGAQLFNEEGRFVNSVDTGLHDVNHRVPGFHFKKDPSFPSVEYAVSLLGFMLDASGIGRLCPATEIMRVQTPQATTHTLIASQTIAGVGLHTALAADPQVLRKWRPAHYSLSFILALLISPEDGKPDNFVVFNNLSLDGHVESVDVVAIDNDHAFVTPFTNIGTFRKKERLYMKSILFCCDQMKHCLDPAVRTTIAALSPGDVLRDWLRALSRSNSTLANLFSAEEMAEALRGGDGSCIPFVLATPIINALYERLCRIVDYCATDDNFTHLDLLEHIVGENLAQTYGAELDVDASPLVRFRRLTKDSYSARSSGIARTMTTTSMMFSSNLGVSSNKRIDLFAPEFSIARALEALDLVDRVQPHTMIDRAVHEIYGGHCDVLISMRHTSLQEKVLANVDWWIVSSAPISTIEELFAKFPRSLRRASFVGLSRVPGELEKAFSLLNLEALTFLDVSRTSGFPYKLIGRRCVSLTHLMARDLRDTAFYLSSWKDFPKLKHIDLTGTALDLIQLPRKNINFPPGFSVRKNTMFIARRVRRVIGTDETEFDVWNRVWPIHPDTLAQILSTFNDDLSTFKIVQLAKRQLVSEETLYYAIAALLRLCFAKGTEFFGYTLLQQLMEFLADILRFMRRNEIYKANFARCGLIYAVECCFLEMLVYFKTDTIDLLRQFKEFYEEKVFLGSQRGTWQALFGLIQEAIQSDNREEIISMISQSSRQHHPCLEEDKSQMRWDNERYSRVVTRHFELFCDPV